MKKAMLAGACALTAVSALSACNDSGPSARSSQTADASTSPDVGTSADAASSADSVPIDAPMPPAPPAPQTAPAPAPGSPAPAEKGEAGARAVLQTWADALEKSDFGTAWEQFRDPPSTRSDYARWWSRYRTIDVTVAPGVMDAGAGSLYYSARTTLTGTTREGKPFRLEGTVILRRVNDVSGATPAQLRWHIGSAILEDAPA